MGDRLTTTIRGFGVLDQKWSPERVHEADTSITEADPQPGTASTTSTQARLVPQIVGVQSQTATLVVTRTGNPGVGVPESLVVANANESGLADAIRAEVGYYLDGETGDDTRAFDPPTKITDWRIPGSLSAADTADAAVFPLSGKVALVWEVGSAVRYACWNPYSESFEHFSNLPSSMDGRASVAVIPGTERVLAINLDRVLYSDDYGDNWQTYSDRGPSTVGVGGATYTGKLRSAFDGQGNLLFIAHRPSDDHAHLFASSDLGASWAQVETSQEYSDWDLAAHPDGSLFFAYIDSSNHVKVARLTGAYAKPSEATAVSAFGDQYSGGEFQASRVWICVDWNGLIWVYAEDDANDGYWRVSVSSDGGLTFVERIHVGTIAIPYFWNAGEATNGPGHWRLVPNAGGGLIAAACFGAVGSGVGHGGMARLGGFTCPQPPERLFGKSQIGTGIELLDKMWVGYGRPEDVKGTYDYAKGGTATTTHSSSDGSPASPLGYVKIDSGAGALAGYYEGDLTNQGAVGAHGLIAVAVEEDAGTDDVIGFWYVLDSANDNASADIAVFFTETGFRVRDGLSAWFGPQVDHDMTQRTWFAITVHVLEETVDILYRHDGETKWNRVTYDGVAFKNATTSTDTATVRWGHTASGATNAVSRWWVSQHSAIDEIADPPESDNLAYTGTDVWGVSAGSEHGYPLPELHDTDAERMALVLLRGGVGVIGDTYEHDLAPGYPREAVFPSIEPSPSRKWRSTATGSNQSLAIDRGYDGRPGGDQSLLWLIAGANARAWQIAYKEDGGSSYTSVGTVDLAEGFEVVGFTRYGQILMPASGGNGARYLHDGELAGGHAVLDLGGTPVAVRIKTNKAGFWNPNSTPPAVVILEDGFNASTAPSSGLCSLVWPAGVMAVHHAGGAGSYRRYWRVTCLSTNVSPDGYYEAGLIAPFGLRVPGKRYGNGWEWSHEPNIRSSEDSYGTERRDERGPMRRVLTLGWDHGAKMSCVRGQSDADYMGVSGAAPLTARDDVWRNLVGVWQESRSGSLPVIALMCDPGHGVTLTDPTLWLYAYLDGALRAQHANGIENVSEFMRVGPVRLKEIV